MTFLNCHPPASAQGAAQSTFKTLHFSVPPTWPRPSRQPRGGGGALLDWQPVPRAGAPNQAAACGGPGWLQLTLCVPPDWESLQLGGMIFAGLLCIVGIAMALSEWRGAGLGAAGALALASGDLALPPPRWQMQTQARPRPQVRHRCPTVCTSCWGGGGSIGG